jgi:hypothetical protein
MSKLAVVGSRSLQNSLLARVSAQDIIRNHIRVYNVTEIVSGGADGPDKWSEEVAHQFNIWATIYKPDWDLYGKSAGFKRNVLIINAADYILLFWDGKSKGTTHDLNLARKSGKNYELFVWKNEKWEKEEERNANI